MRDAIRRSAHLYYVAVQFPAVTTSLVRNGNGSEVKISTSNRLFLPVMKKDSLKPVKGYNQNYAQ